MSHDDKLIRMANQIAAFFATQPGENQAERVAQHLKDFWDPRMREAIKALPPDEASGLHPLAAKAVQSLA